MKAIKRITILFMVVISALTASVLSACKQEPTDLYLRMSPWGDGYKVVGYTDGLLFNGNILVPETYKGSAVTIIETEVFRDNGSVKSLITNYGLELIEASAFENCKKLKKVSINSPAIIGNCAFKGCVSLSNLELHGVTKMEKECFAGCTSLKKVTIPDSIEEMQFGVFSGCNSLKSIVFEGFQSLHIAVSGITGGAFAGCPKIETLESLDYPRGRIYVENNCIIDGEKKELIAGIKTSVIPDDGSVEVLGAGSFNASYLEEITIPESVTKIYASAFYACKQLKKVILPQGSEWKMEKTGSYGTESLTVNPNSPEETAMLLIGNADFVLERVDGN